MFWYDTELDSVERGLMNLAAAKVELTEACLETVDDVRTVLSSSSSSSCTLSNLSLIISRIYNNSTFALNSLHNLQQSAFVIGTAFYTFAVGSQNLSYLCFINSLCLSPFITVSTKSTSCFRFNFCNRTKIVLFVSRLEVIRTLTNISI